MAPLDPRFARLTTDPRFIRPSKASQKVVVDERFKSLLGDDKDGKDSLDSNVRVDKYGKKVGKEKVKKDLRAFYRLDGKQEKGKKPLLDRARGEGLEESSSEEDDDEEGDDEEEDGQGASASDADSSSDDDEVVLGSKSARTKEAKRRARRASSEISIDLNEDDEEPVASTSAAAAQQQVESSIPTMENATNRIAIVNLDWDNVRAVDLYKVFESVLSPSASGSLATEAGIGSRKSKTKIGKGRVISVKIYPSEFGKSRIEREEKEGPPVEIFSKNAKPQLKSGKGKSSKQSSKRNQQEEEEEDSFSDDDSLQEDEGEEYDEVALRRYQLERLRYYYAIVEFDTAAAGQHAYEEIDSTEFEATANVFDLRYVPDDTTFDDEPTDIATPSTIEMQVYKPAEFVTDALRNSKVKLTWDADDPQRMKLTRNGQAVPEKGKGKGSKVKAEEQVDYSHLLASDSEDDEGADRDRLRAKFGLGATSLEAGNEQDEEDDTDREMEITFGPALSASRTNGEAEPTAAENETSLQTYERKERERREAKKLRRRLEKKKAAGGRDRLALQDDEDSDPDEAFDANLIGGAGGNEEDSEGDGFFDIDGDDQAEAVKEAAPVSKLSKKAAKQLEREQKAKETAALSLLVGGDGSDDEEGGDGRHFDMQTILRAEKTVAKPKKSLKKGKDKQKYAEAKSVLAKEQDAFELDLKDERFKNLHTDHEFALDPSNPKFLKTKNMQKVLDESRKRRDERVLDRESASSAQLINGSNGPEKGLSSLVESIKRKSQANEAQKGRGKRQRKD